MLSYAWLIDEINDILDTLIKTHNVTEYRVGMALGTDMLVTELLLKLKKKKYQIKIIPCIPCISQPDFWPDEQKLRYYHLLTQLETPEITSQNYTPNCMLERNLSMLEKSDMVLAVFDGRYSGGTAYTVHLAAKKQKPMIIINPFRKDVIWKNYK